MTTWHSAHTRRGAALRNSSDATTVDTAAARPNTGQIQPKYRGIGQQLPRERRQERRRNDVAEAEDAVAADEEPGIGGEALRAQSARRSYARAAMR